MELPPSSDARADLTGHWHLPVGAIRWWPFLLLLAVASYGLLAVTFLAPMPRLGRRPADLYRGRQPVGAADPSQLPDRAAAVGVVTPGLAG